MNPLCWEWDPETETLSGQLIAGDVDVTRVTSGLRPAYQPDQRGLEASEQECRGLLTDVLRVLPWRSGELVGLEFGLGTSTRSGTSTRKPRDVAGQVVLEARRPRGLVATPEGVAWLGGPLTARVPRGLQRDDPGDPIPPAALRTSTSFGNWTAEGERNTYGRMAPLLFGDAGAVPFVTLIVDPDQGRGVVRVQGGVRGQTPDPGVASEVAITQPDAEARGTPGLVEPAGPDRARVELWGGLVPYDPGHQAPPPWAHPDRQQPWAVRSFLDLALVVGKRKRDPPPGGDPPPPPPPPPEPPEPPEKPPKEPPQKPPWEKLPEVEDDADGNRLGGDPSDATVTDGDLGDRDQGDEDETGRQRRQPFDLQDGTTTAPPWEQMVTAAGAPMELSVTDGQAPVACPLGGADLGGPTAEEIGFGTGVSTPGPGEPGSASGSGEWTSPTGRGGATWRPAQLDLGAGGARVPLDGTPSPKTLAGLTGPKGLARTPAPHEAGAPSTPWGYAATLQRELEGLHDVVQSAFMGGRHGSYAGSMSVMATNQGGVGVARQILGTHWLDADDADALPPALSVIQVLDGRTRGMEANRPAMTIERWLSGDATARGTGAPPVLELRKRSPGLYQDQGDWIRDQHRTWRIDQYGKGFFAGARFRGNRSRGGDVGDVELVGGDLWLRTSLGVHGWRQSTVTAGAVPSGVYKLDHVTPAEAVRSGLWIQHTSSSQSYLATWQLRCMGAGTGAQAGFGSKLSIELENAAGTGVAFGGGIGAAWDTAGGQPYLDLYAGQWPVCRIKTGVAGAGLALWQQHTSGTAATPDAGWSALYYKASDDRLYYKVPGGTEYGPLGAPVTDHGALTGLLDDDHTQYALLAGRAGGQSLLGGTGASETLTLSSTAHATLGKILIDHDPSHFGGAYDQAQDFFGVGTQSPAVPLHVVQFSAGAADAVTEIGRLDADRSAGVAAGFGVEVSAYLNAARYGALRIVSTVVDPPNQRAAYFSVRLPNNGAEAERFRVAAWGAVTVGTWESTAIGPAYGGTGQTAWAAGDLLYGTGAATTARLSIGAANTLLYSTGSAPAWGTVSSRLDTLGVAAQGQIPYRGASAWALLGAGTVGQPLLTGGAGANPSWGTLGAAAGGTGQTGYTIGDLLYATGAAALGKLAIGAANTLAYSTGSAPAWRSVSASLDVLGSTRGSVLYRGAATWDSLVPGTAGQVLQSGGAGADPSWTTLAAATLPNYCGYPSTTNFVASTDVLAWGPFGVADVVVLVGTPVSGAESDGAGSPRWTSYAGTSNADDPAPLTLDFYCGVPAGFSSWTTGVVVKTKLTVGASTTARCTVTVYDPATGAAGTPSTRDASTSDTAYTAQTATPPGSWQAGDLLRFRVAITRTVGVNLVGARIGQIRTDWT